MTGPKCTIQLGPCDDRFLYTGGVTEANNERLELYGEKRLLKILHDSTSRKYSPTELLPYVEEQVELFVNKAEQADDITMLSVKYLRKSVGDVSAHSSTDDAIPETF